MFMYTPLHVWKGSLTEYFWILSEQWPLALREIVMDICFVFPDSWDKNIHHFNQVNNPYLGPTFNVFNVCKLFMRKFGAKYQEYIEKRLLLPFTDSDVKLHQRLSYCPAGPDIFFSCLQVRLYGISDFIGREDVMRRRQNWPHDHIHQRDVV